MSKNRINGQRDGYRIAYVTREPGYIKFEAHVTSRSLVKSVFVCTLSRARYSGGRRGPAVWVVAVDGKRIDTARGIAMAKFRAKRAVMNLAGVSFPVEKAA